MKKEQLIKKRLLVLAMGTTLALAGCGNNDNQVDNNNSKITEKEKNNTMSKEEMDKLVAGQVVTNDPNQEYLEQKDLIALYRYNVKCEYDDGEIINDVVYFDKRMKEEESLEDSLYKWTEYRELVDITIYNIDNYSISHDEKTWTKSVMNDGQVLIYPVLTDSKIEELKNQKQYTK